MKRKADRQNAREEHEKALRTSGEEEAVEFVPRSLHCATIKGAVAAAGMTELLVLGKTQG